VPASGKTSAALSAAAFGRTMAGTSLRLASDIFVEDALVRVGADPDDAATS